MADPENISELALALINAESTMSLATARENHAWVAPVYYVLHEGRFYFFSAPDARHIQEALDSGQASAAIYPVARTWQGIKGIQMSGLIKSAGMGLRAIRAIGAYTAKFPFVKEFFEPGQTMDLDNFANRFKVRFYCFDPSLVIYLDNSIKFGFKAEVSLS